MTAGISYERINPKDFTLAILSEDINMKRKASISNNFIYFMYSNYI